MKWPNVSQPIEIYYHLIKKRSSGRIKILLQRLLHILLIISFIPFQAWGQSAAQAIKEQVTETVTIQQETQQAQDAWAHEKALLEARYQAARTQLKAMEKEAGRLETKISGTETRVKELERRLEESTRLEQGLQENMEALLARLESWVARDLPFLPEERRERLLVLKELLFKTEISPAEKLRRLLEALQVEGAYGDTIEVYQQRIEIQGQEIFADIFRLGRLSIFWQTPDGKRAGEYDRVSKKWVELPDTFKRNIQIAVEIANKRRPIELIKLPVGRLAP